MFEIFLPTLDFRPIGEAGGATSIGFDTRSRSLVMAKKSSAGARSLRDP